MYLVELNKQTGLVKLDKVHDGILAIKSFRALIDKYGIEGFTIVALAVDHLSPIRHYSLKERPMKAMKEIYDDVNKYNFGEDEFQAAAIVYDRLQYNAELHELRLIREMRMNKIQAIDEEKDEDRKLIMINQLTKIKDTLAAYEKRVDMASILNSAPVVGGYELSRIEELITNNKSFYHAHTKKSQEYWNEGESNKVGDTDKK